MLVIIFAYINFIQIGSRLDRGEPCYQNVDSNRFGLDSCDLVDLSRFRWYIKTV